MESSAFRSGRYGGVRTARQAARGAQKRTEEDRREKRRAKDGRGAGTEVALSGSVCALTRNTSARIKPA